MHPPSRLFYTAAVVLPFLGVAVSSPEPTTTSTTVVRTSIGDRTSEDTRSLRAMDGPTHEMTELDEDRYIASTNVLWWLEKSENAWKAVLAKTPWKDSFYKMPPKDSTVKIPLKHPSFKIPPKESSLNIPKTISRQTNPTAAQLTARSELLKLAREGIDVKDFDYWLQIVLHQGHDFRNTLFEQWKSNGLDFGRLKSLLEGAGKGDDSLVLTLAQDFDKYVGKAKSMT
uniref:RxLR effector protein n=1 Tax=Peronospora matthiolae TaxID=2874970 RepID=A0AAV1VI62_9STRA